MICLGLSDTRPVHVDTRAHTLLVSGVLGQTSIIAGQEADPLITLLIQSPDEDTLRRLLVTYPYRRLTEEAGCRLFVIEDGSVTEYEPPQGPT